LSAFAMACAAAWALPEPRAWATAWADAEALEPCRSFLVPAAMSSTQVLLEKKVGKGWEDLCSKWRQTHAAPEQLGRDAISMCAAAC
jgi:hypothetical protein